MHPLRTQSHTFIHLSLDAFRDLYLWKRLTSQVDICPASHRLSSGKILAQVDIRPRSAQVVPTLPGPRALFRDSWSGWSGVLSVLLAPHPHAEMPSFPWGLLAAILPPARRHPRPWRQVWLMDAAVPDQTHSQISLWTNALFGWSYFWIG